jgi:hypothetical protein
MSSTSFLEDAESHLAPRTPPYSRPTTAFSDLGLAGYTPSLNLLETQRPAASSTSRLQTKHKRSHTEGHDARRSIGKFSKLLGTVLGTPLATPSATSAVDTRMTDSRPPSPSPSMDYTLVSAPSLPTTPHRHSVPLVTASTRTVTPENATCSSRSMFFASPSKKGIDSISSLAAPPSPSKSGNQRILPRLWTALSSPTKEAGIRFKRKGKGKAVSSEPSEEYPLDGEEGELVDDEACFVNLPTTIGLSSSLCWPLYPSNYYFRYHCLPSTGGFLVPSTILGPKNRSGLSRYLPKLAASCV